MTKKSRTKKLSKNTKIIFIFLFVIGIGLGGFASYFVTKNDVFILIGESYITQPLGQEYQEQGVKIIAFGKDVSQNVKIEGQVNTNKKGEYVLKYTIDNFRFQRYTLYRKIVVEA